MTWTWHRRPARSRSVLQERLEQRWQLMTRPEPPTAPRPRADGEASEASPRRDAPFCAKPLPTNQAPRRLPRDSFGQRIEAATHGDRFRQVAPATRRAPEQFLARPILPRPVAEVDRS